MRVLFILFLIGLACQFSLAQESDLEQFDRKINNATDEQAIYIFTQANNMVQSPDKARKKAKKLFKKMNPAQKAKILELVNTVNYNTMNTAGKPKVHKSKLTEISFEEPELNFGTVVEGESVKYRFKFTNTGDNELNIGEAKSSCGCTVPEWPKDPIAPGESGEIVVVFNTKGKFGSQKKSVTIMANTEPVITRVTLSGEVLRKQ